MMVMLLSALTTFGGSSVAAGASPPPRPPPPRGVVTLPGVVNQNRQAPREEKVTVGMMVVHATDAHSNVDERLGNLTRYLSHMRFTGYELLATHEAQLIPGDSETFSIEGNREMTITLLSKDAQQVRLRVQITSGRGGKLIDTTLSIARNGTFIVAGPKYRDGILVLPLKALY
ncbi:MAG: hypothetical protein ACI8S6_003101 [Myxococcota bacterium]|jgi:hypothetical protein